MFSTMKIVTSNRKDWPRIQRLKDKIETADAIVIGAGAGLSTSAGFQYTGERFREYFGDFARKYGFRDMYSGGFYPYKTLEEQWAYWSRYIYVNRYMDPPEPVYENLYRLVKDKDYFVLTTNVDHCFQKAGFDKRRLFYTQGDYGLFQCSRPCDMDTYENEDIVKRMAEAQGYRIGKDGSLSLPEGRTAKMAVPTELLPICPKCGAPLTMNLRADSTFVEDEGWLAASRRWSDFVRRHEGLSVLFLELGVGYNTPAIIKYPFWQMTAQNPNGAYACINDKEAFCPEEIADRSIYLEEDIGKILRQLLEAEPAGRRDLTNSAGLL